MTGRVINNLIEVRQGDSFVIDFEIKERGKPVNVTDATLVMEVKDSGGNTMFTCIGDHVDGRNGKMLLNITPDMTNIPVGDYLTDIQLMSGDGSVNTLFPANVNAVGTFRITEQITTYTPSPEPEPEPGSDSDSDSI